MDTLARMRQLIGTTAEWATDDLVIGKGEIAVEVQSTGKARIKVGDGILQFSALGYVTDPVVYRGEWSALTTYAASENVSWLGSSYGSRIDGNLNHQPDTSPTQWQLVAGIGPTGGASSSTTVAWSGDISPAPVALTANQNDFNPAGLATATVLKIAPDAAGRIITGLVSGSVNGRFIIWRNTTAFEFRLSATTATGSTNSASFNRFAFGHDIIVRQGADVAMQYDLGLARWKLHAAPDQEGFFAAAATIAAAATTDIGALNSERVTITAAAPLSLSSFGSRSNQGRWVRFAGALTLVNNAALALQGGVSRNIVAGDVGYYTSDAAGNWSELAFVGWTMLTTIAGAAARLDTVEAAVAAIPVQPAAATLEADGAAQVVRTPLGREIERLAAFGEPLVRGAEEAPVGWLETDGSFVMAGANLQGVTTLLTPTQAATVKGTTFPRVQGGFRAPYVWRGNPSVGRIGRGVIVPDMGRVIPCIFAMGQSNHGGLTGQPLIRTAYPHAQRLLIPRTSQPADNRLFLNQLANQAITSAEVLGFTSLVGARGYPGDATAVGTNQSEVAAATFARLISEAFDNWIPYLVTFTCWNGGNNVDSMLPAGTSNVNQNVRAVAAALVRLAADQGYAINFIANLIDQGEADTGNTALADTWVTINDGVSTYLQGLTGQPNPVVAFITQTSSFSTSTGEKTKIARYKLDQKLIPTFPRYMIGQAHWNPIDYLHMLATGAFRLGEANGIAMFQHLYQGGYVPMHALTATAPLAGGSTVTVNFSEAPAIGTEMAEAAFQNGLYVKTTSGATVDIAITGATVAGSSVQLALASPISPGTVPAPIVTVGTYPGQTGPRTAAGIVRTNIRSASSVGWSQLDGRRIYKPAMHDTLPITYV